MSLILTASFFIFNKKINANKMENKITSVKDLQKSIDVLDYPVLKAIVHKFNNDIKAVKQAQLMQFDFTDIISQLEEIQKQRVVNKIILLIDKQGYIVRKDFTVIGVIHITWNIDTKINSLSL